MSKDAGAAAFRKTWDKEAFEAKAKARLDEELRLEEEREANIQAPQPIVQRAPLQRREADLQLTKFVNQRQMVTLGQAANGEMSGVYWCAVCQCHLRDSANYLLHINGKKHNRMLGMSMRAERATVGEVRERLASYKEEKQPELTKEEKAALFLDDFNQRVAAREEEEYQAKLDKSSRKRARKEEEQGAVSTADPTEADLEAQEQMAAAGFDFAGFGGSRKNE